MKNQLKKIDEQIFQAIDKIKENNEFQKFQDTINSIDEEFKTPLKIFLSLLLVSLPLIVAGLFYSSNNSLKDEITARRQILDLTGEMMGNKNLLLQAGQTVISPYQMDSFNTFQGLISKVASVAGIDLSNIKLSGFNDQAISDEIIQANISIKLSNLTNDELINFINGLVIKEKIKIGAMNLEKSKNSTKIEGVIELTHFGKGKKEDDFL
jgi:hypothetical protein